MQYAPILVSVYNRFHHLKKCIEALQQNAEARESCLYIVSDAAGREKDKDIVEKIRIFVNEISGFKEVTLLANEYNKGSVKSLQHAREFIFSKYDRYIFMEDDIEVGPFFLEYMNLCMSKYASYDNVFAVSGYSHMFKIQDNYPYDIYFAASYPAWGIGLWKDKNKAFDDEVTYRFKEFIEENKQFLKGFKNYSYSAYRILMNDLHKNKVAGDARREFYLFCKGMVCAIPVRSLTRSIGHDGSGEHCPYDYFLQNQQIDKKQRKYMFPDSVFEDKEIIRRRKWHFSNFSKKIKTIKRYYYNTLYS